MRSRLMWIQFFDNIEEIFFFLINLVILVLNISGNRVGKSLKSTFDDVS